MQNIKVLVTYHDEHTLLKSKIVQPIQTGCAKAQKLFSGMLRDDIGENISDKNDRYCELSAQYWAWKNYDKLGNPDYIGFMHYRRHFMFDDWSGNPNWCWLPKGNVYFVPTMTPEYLRHIDDKYIKRKLADCDCLVLKPYDVKNLKSKNIRTQYSKLAEQDVHTFDVFIATVKSLYPQFTREIKMLENGSLQYLCNMFVMKKELFDEYSEFCFSILQAVDSQIDSSKMSEVASRFLGYLGEFCLSIFVFNLLKRENVKVKELNGSYILSDEVILNPKRKYWYYYFLSKITIGSMRKKYKQKRKKLKQFIRYQK